MRQIWASESSASTAAGRAPDQHSAQQRLWSSRNPQNALTVRGPPLRSWRDPAVPPEGRGMSLQTVRKERGDLEREKRFLAAHAAGHDRIYRYFRRRTENAATAEDLCAEVFRITWEKTGQDDSLSVTVLFGIAKNVLRNHDRSAVRSAGLLYALQLQRDPNPASMDPRSMTLRASSVPRTARCCSGSLLKARHS